MSICVSCDGSELIFSHEYLYRSEQFRNLFPDLKVLKCAECGLYQVDHSLLNLSKLTTYYKDFYRKDAGIVVSSTKWDQERFVARGQALASVAEKYLPSEEVRRIFEVGAGYGINLKKQKDLFPNAELFTDEIDKDALGDSIKEASINDGPFDIVLMSHVLEHLIYPKKMIERINNNLRAEGLLIVEVPNEGPDFICQASFHEPFHEPHITFFQPDTLEDFFKRNFASDFCVKQTSTAGDKINDVQKLREQKYPNSTLKQLKVFLRKFSYLEKISRQLYCAAIYNFRHPKVDFDDDPESADRIFLRIILSTDRK